MSFCDDHCVSGAAEPEDGGKQGVSVSSTPVYSELWFILLLALLGLFLLAILLGLVLQKYGDTLGHAQTHTHAHTEWIAVASCCHI